MTMVPRTADAIVSKAAELRLPTGDTVTVRDVHESLDFYMRQLVRVGTEIGSYKRETTEIFQRPGHWSSRVASLLHLGGYPSPAYNTMLAQTLRDVTDELERVKASRAEAEHGDRIIDRYIRVISALRDVTTQLEKAQKTWRAHKYPPL